MGRIGMIVKCRECKTEWFYKIDDDTKCPNCGGERE